METLNLSGDRLKFTLTGINSTAVELTKVKTVKQILVSKGCIAKKMDLEKLLHLQDFEIPKLNDDEVMLLIGLKEQPQLFLPLEAREGGDEEPIGVRYTLGWTVMGPVGGMKETRDCLANFVEARTSFTLSPVMIQRSRSVRESKLVMTASCLPVKETQMKITYSLNS